MGAAGILPIVLLITGVILIIVEMIIPGFGVPGVLGLILTVAGIAMQATSLLEAVLLVLIVMLILAAALIVISHLARNGKLLHSPLILKTSLNKEQGFSSAEDLEHLLGAVGETVTVLRPTGCARFDGEKLDVVSDAEYIESGCKVEVIKVEGSRIVVRQVSDEEQDGNNKSNGKGE